MVLVRAIAVWVVVLNHVARYDSYRLILQPLPNPTAIQDHTCPLALNVPIGKLFGKLLRRLLVVVHFGVEVAELH